MSHHEDQPTISTEEDDVGPGPAGVRSYECVFCKRGFTTAQALGGHMNIHRRDRAKSRPYYGISSKLQQDHHTSHTGPRFYHPIFASYPPSYIHAPPNHDQEGQVVCTTYFSSTSTEPPIYNENNHHGAITSPSREGKMISTLSLQFARSHGEDNHSKRTAIQDGNQEDELDLELRLGHDPCN